MSNVHKQVFELIDAIASAVRRMGSLDGCIQAKQLQDNWSKFNPILFPNYVIADPTATTALLVADSGVQPDITDATSYRLACDALWVKYIKSGMATHFAVVGAEVAQVWTGQAGWGEFVPCSRNPDGWRFDEQVHKALLMFTNTSGRKPIELHLNNLALTAIRDAFVLTPSIGVDQLIAYVAAMLSDAQYSRVCSTLSPGTTARAILYDCAAAAVKHLGVTKNCSSRGKSHTLLNKVAQMLYERTNDPRLAGLVDPHYIAVSKINEHLAGIGSEQHTPMPESEWHKLIAESHPYIDPTTMPYCVSSLHMLRWYDGRLLTSYQALADGFYRYLISNYFTATEAKSLTLQLQADIMRFYFGSAGIELRGNISAFSRWLQLFDIERPLKSPLAAFNLCIAMDWLRQSVSPNHAVPLVINNVVDVINEDESLFQPLMWLCGELSNPLKSIDMSTAANIPTLIALFLHGMCGHDNIQISEMARAQLQRYVSADKSVEISPLLQYQVYQELGVDDMQNLQYANQAYIDKLNELEQALFALQRVNPSNPLIPNQYPAQLANWINGWHNLFAQDVDNCVMGLSLLSKFNILVSSLQGVDLTQLKHALSHQVGKANDVYLPTLNKLGILVGQVVTDTITEVQTTTEVLAIDVLYNHIVAVQKVAKALGLNVDDSTIMELKMRIINHRVGLTDSL